MDERSRGQGRFRAGESPSSLLAGRRVCPKCPMGGVPLAHPLEGFPSGGVPRGPVGRDGWAAGAVPNKNSVWGLDSDGFQWGGAWVGRLGGSTALATCGEAGVCAARESNGIPPSSPSVHGCVHPHLWQRMCDGP